MEKSVAVPSRSCNGGRRCIDNPNRFFVFAVDAADLGDLDAEFLVGEAEDHELAWYDPGEVAFLVELG